MMFAHMHSEITPLLGLVAAVRARMTRLLATTLDVLVATQRRLPAIFLSAMAAHIPGLWIIAWTQRRVAQRQFVGHARRIVLRLLLHGTSGENGVALARIVHTKLFGCDCLHTIVVLQLNAMVLMMLLLIVLLLATAGLHHGLDMMRLQLAGMYVMRLLRLFVLMDRLQFLRLVLNCSDVRLSAGGLHMLSNLRGRKADANLSAVGQLDIIDLGILH